MGGAPQFRAKGRGFTAMLEYAAKRAPGGLEGTLAILPPSDRAYVRQLFIESGWYDAFVLERLMRAVAEKQGDTLRDFARTQAVVTAHRDTAGIYRHSFRAGTPAELARRLPRGFNRYFEPMEAALETIDGACASYSLRRVPQELRDLAEGVTEGFCTGAMQAAGIAPPLFSWNPSLADDPVGPTPTRKLSFRMLW
jgi:hypothetical protein